MVIEPRYWSRQLDLPMERAGLVPLKLLTGYLFEKLIVAAAIREDPRSELAFSCLSSGIPAPC